MKRLLFAFIVFAVQINAQQANLKSAFVSAHMGVYDISADQFSKTYGSNVGFAPAISLGLPISTTTYLYGKLIYFPLVRGTLRYAA